MWADINVEEPKRDDSGSNEVQGEFTSDDKQQVLDQTVVSCVDHIYTLGNII